MAVLVGATSVVLVSAHMSREAGVGWWAGCAASVGACLGVRGGSRLVVVGRAVLSVSLLAVVLSGVLPVSGAVDLAVIAIAFLILMLHPALRYSGMAGHKMVSGLLTGMGGIAHKLVGGLGVGSCAGFGACTTSAGDNQTSERSAGAMPMIIFGLICTVAAFTTSLVLVYIAAVGLHAWVGVGGWAGLGIVGVLTCGVVVVQLCGAGALVMLVVVWAMHVGGLLGAGVAVEVGLRAVCMVYGALDSLSCPLLAGA